MNNKIVDDNNSNNIEEQRQLIEKLIRQYADMIYRIAYQNTGSYADAEDILQEVSIAMITKNAPLHDEEYLKRWLIRVTINKCHDLNRRVKRLGTEPLEQHEDLAAEEKHDLSEELSRLPEQYRNIIFLYYYEDYSLKEIAGIMHKSINTISSGLQRARKQLKKILTEE